MNVWLRILMAIIGLALIFITSALANNAIVARCIDGRLDPGPIKRLIWALLWIIGVILVFTAIIIR